MNKRLCRRLSRRQPGSQRWYAANRRLDVIHKMTTGIASIYRLVVVEDLIALGRSSDNVKGMSQNRKLALADAALGEILRQLDYKAEQLVQVDRWYASSKTCSACGYVHRELGVPRLRRYP